MTGCDPMPWIPEQRYWTGLPYYILLGIEPHSNSKSRPSGKTSHETRNISDAFLNRIFEIDNGNRLIFHDDDLMWPSALNSWTEVQYVLNFFSTTVFFLVTDYLCDDVSMWPSALNSWRKVVRSHIVILCKWTVPNSKSHSCGLPNTNI